ncbi:MAG: GNAT family N-acetyltransferase [Betaproteobacteria bacterium]
MIDLALPHATDRLLLRRFATGDLARFQAYRCDPEVGRYQGWSVMDDSAAAAFIATMATTPIGIPGDWVQIAIADRASGNLVGDIGLGVRDEPASVAELGFTIAPSSQGRGLGTEAVRGALEMLFARTGIELVEGITDARNAPSIGLLERVGMRMQRTQDVLFKSEPCIEYVFSLSRAQWFELTSKSNSSNPR